MDKTHASDGRPDTRAGGIILVVASALAALLVIAGLIYATGTGRRSEAALAAAGCEPGLSSDARACTTQPMLAGQYMAIMTPAATQLDVEEAAYTGSEHSSLAAAETALTAEAATDRALATSLAGIAFPPAITPVAQALIRADQARAGLLAQQARSSTLTRMRSFDPRIQAASAAVQTEMNLLREAIDSPPRTNTAS